MDRLRSENVRQLPPVPPSGWHHKDQSIIDVDHIEDFRKALALVIDSIKIADKLDYHPKWKNLCSIVHVERAAHDAKGMTSKGLQLIKQTAET